MKQKITWLVQQGSRILPGKKKLFARRSALRIKNLGGKRCNCKEAWHDTNEKKNRFAPGCAGNKPISHQQLHTLSPDNASGRKEVFSTFFYPHTGGVVEWLSAN